MLASITTSSRQVTLQTRPDSKRVHCMQVLYKHQHRLGPASCDPDHHDILIADPCLALTVAYMYTSACHSGTVPEVILVRVLHRTYILLNLGMHR